MITPSAEAQTKMISRVKAQASNVNVCNMPLELFTTTYRIEAEELDIDERQAVTDWKGTTARKDAIVKVQMTIMLEALLKKYNNACSNNRVIVPRSTSCSTMPILFSKSSVYRVMDMTLCINVTVLL